MRSLVYAISIMLFVNALKLLNPVNVILIQSCTLTLNTSFLRIKRSKKHPHLWIVFFLSLFAFLILLGVISIPYTQTTTKIPKDNSDYWLGFRYAGLSGMFLAKVSRASQALSDVDALRHEIYMSFWASVVTSAFVPFFLMLDLSDMDQPTHIILEQGYWLGLLVILIAVKVTWTERGVLKRFIEDYDNEIHGLPWFF